MFTSNTRDVDPASNSLQSDSRSALSNQFAELLPKVVFENLPQNNSDNLIVAYKDNNIAFDFSGMQAIDGVHRDAQVQQFARTWHTFSYNEMNPVYPVGLGEWAPGETEKDRPRSWRGALGTDLGWNDLRTGFMRYNPDGSTSYLYSGSGGSDSRSDFISSETISRDGQLLESHAMYSSRNTQVFKAPNGSNLTIENVVAVDARRNADGTYTSRVQDKDGSVTTFSVAADGQVTKVSIAIGR